MTGNLQTKIVARAIIVINNKILLGKRASGHDKDKYALIGGKPDGNETPSQAVVREVKEETGLEFENPVLWKETFSSSVPGECWHAYFYTGEVIGNLNLKKDEVLDVIYVDKTDLQNIDIAFNHKEILNEFLLNK